VIVNWTDLLVRATIGIMSASDAAPLPRLGEVFFDVRGDSRSMRLSWYADTGVAVFSVWSGGRCTGTFRLPIDDLPRMIEILQRGPERRRRPAPDNGRPERGDRGRPRSEPGYYGEGDYSDGDNDDGVFGDGDGAHDGGGHDDAGYEPGGYDQRRYDQGARDLPAHDQGGYDQGNPDAGYGPTGHSQGGFRRDGYAADGYGADRPGPDEYGADRRGPDGYGADRYGADAHGPDGYGADAHGPDGYGPAAHRPDGFGPDYGADGYGADDPVRNSRSRPAGGGHRAAGPADSAGYPDVPGYGGATPAEAPRPGARRSDVPAGGNWRGPGDYQPAEYQTDGYQPGGYHADGFQPGEYQTDGHQLANYQTDGYEAANYQADGYQPREYQADGYQTAAHQLGPADHAAGAQSDLAGYGHERFVPPYVQAPGDGYPNDNPVPGRARRQSGTGPAYPADHGGVSAEPQPYARPPRSGPGYFEGSEDRLAADTPVSARYSAGRRGS